MGGEIDLQCSDDSLLIFRKEEKKAVGAEL